MPQGIHDVDLDLPIQTVWAFVSVMENWIPLVPGYLSHEIVNDRKSTWTFTSDIGILKKKINLQVDIVEWHEPSLVKFNLTGINENFAGEGFFKAQALGDMCTRMTGALDITAKGVKAPVINPVLKNHVPEMTAELAEAVATRMRELASTTPNRK